VLTSRSDRSEESCSVCLESDCLEDEGMGGLESFEGEEGLCWV
jgi:hypothetical protein